jgi:SAM-dependent methyltransferase
MERRLWLDGLRASIERRYDEHASTFDDDSPISTTHLRFVEAVIRSCPPGGAILDAPCGTGRYLASVLALGRTVVGIDQSAGMLARARAKQPEVRLEKIGLQELDFEDEFDAAMCIDAMEYVFPEDWPLVLGNLRRAVRGGGLVYLTVEQVDASELASVFAKAKAEGLPAVYGENLRRGGYHYYPSSDQLASLLAAEDLEVVDEDVSRGGTYTYRHVLVQ